MSKSKRLVFGKSRLPVDERECPAWPVLTNPDEDAPDPEDEKAEEPEDDTSDE